LTQKLTLEDNATSLFHGFLAALGAYVVLSWGVLNFTLQYYFGFFFVCVTVAMLNGLVCHH